ncbi:MAG TPA: hypothetical protein VF058_00865 [Actinomycetota bacterium]
MARRVLVRGLAAAFAAMLVPGTVWSEPAADRARAAEPPSSEATLAQHPSPLGLVGGRSEDGWATRRDERTPTGDQMLGALLLGVAIALLAGTERVAARRTRRSIPWTVRALGARSPPLVPA